MPPKQRDEGRVDRQTQEALRHAESELRLLSAALTTAQEKERKRIASELHDSIGQSLGALSFGIGAAMDLQSQGDHAGANELLEKLRAQVKNTVDEVRRIAMNLHPASLDDLGIVGTLSWFFREFRSIYPGVRLTTNISIVEGDVPVPLRATIYRVVQEACNNVIKHARAGEIRIEMIRRSRDMILRVVDDGCGFADGNTVRHYSSDSGLGLTVMRDRIEFSGGSFRLVTAVGKGTCITASWPFYATKDHRQ